MIDIDNNKIVQALGTVNDPTSGNNVISMKLISELKVDGNKVSFSVETSELPDTAKFRLHEDLTQSIISVYPEANIDIHFKKQTSGRTLSHVKNIIAVASGKGGVGKSTVSTNMALALKELGHKVGLIDADLYGPSIPTMLGIQKEKPVIKELYGRHRINPIPVMGLQTISIGNIIDPEQAVVLRGPRLGGIIKQFINEVIWPELDYIIIDLPPGTGDIQLTLVQTIPLTGAVMVTTPQDVAIADAIKAMNMFRLENIKVPIIGVVENMAWFTPPELPNKKYRIFGEGGGQKLADLANSLLIGQIPLVTDIRAASDNGIPIVENKDSPLRETYLSIARMLADQVQIRNETIAPTQVVGVNIQQ